MSRGRVCGVTHRVNVGQAMKTGWPKCCGYTMTIDSPEERKELEAKNVTKNKWI